MTNLEYMQIEGRISAEIRNANQNKSIAFLFILGGIILIANAPDEAISVLLWVLSGIAIFLGIVEWVVSAHKTGKFEDKKMLLDRLYFEEEEVEEAIKQLRMPPESGNKTNAQFPTGNRPPCFHGGFFLLEIDIPYRLDKN